jgi:hypothetical protein
METLYDPVKDDLENFQNEFLMSSELWDKFNLEGLDVDFSKWKRVKFMSDSGDLHNDISKIPNQYGGIYVYVIVPPIIPECGAYIMYVGKATKTSTENLRARVRSYKSTFSEETKRKKLHRLFKKWGKYVYVYYLPVDISAGDINTLEERLISAFVPPCNSMIPIKTVRDAVSAFI